MLVLYETGGDLQDQIYKTGEDPRYEIKLIALIGLGVFLFLLFFHPFVSRFDDADERLAFTFGLAMISFAVMLIFRIILPASVTSRLKIESLRISNEVGLILLIWVFIAIPTFFYLHYFGRTPLDLMTSLKIVIFSALPSIILKIADVNMSIRVQLRHYVRRNLRMEQELANRESSPDGLIHLDSETQKDNFSAQASHILLIKSADNYVEVYCKENDEIRPKIIRNTLKNIQQQLVKYPNFVRCHRSSIVNTNYVVTLTNNYKGHWLKMLDYKEDVPVSRQYLLKLKELLGAE